jgi:hypothetical protein
MFSSLARAGDDACSETSRYAKKACQNSAIEAYNLALGKCENVAENKEDACEAKAKADLKLALNECKDQFEARQEVCKELGGGPYLPNGIKRFHFVSELTGNTYFPLTPATYKYESFDETDLNNVIERDTVEVTKGTRTILGVTCRVVRDIVRDPDGNVTEDTTDWYAQDDKGNVWYFGEIAQQFMTDEDGTTVLVGIEGSWTAGVEGAKPGFIMLANPTKGNVYRQEFALGDAEDVARVIGKVKFGSLKQTYPILAKVPSNIGIADNADILHTQDFSALEPDVLEDKYYAPGLGLILTVANDGTQEVLVEFTSP